MARINGSANGNGNGKYPARASLGEVSQGEVPLGYNLNGEDDEIFDVTESKRMGHTRNDQKDMSRMGKRQELIVSLLYTHTSHTHTHLFFLFFGGGGKKNFFFPPFFSVLLNPTIRSCLSLTKKKLEEFSSTIGPELRRCTPGNVGVSFDVN